MTIAERVRQKLKQLPLEMQQGVSRYVEREAEPGRPLESPRDTLREQRSDLSFEQFQQLRHEMWGASTNARIRRSPIEVLW